MERKRKKDKINKLIKKLEGFFRKEKNILTVYLFGSYGTEDQTELSDIDIAILFADTVSMLEELGIAAEIDFILKQGQIDLLNLNKASVILQHRVISTGEKIFERDSLTTADFIENTLKFYFDYGLVYKKFRDDFREELRGEYLNGN